MTNKAILIIVDGMRPDALEKTAHPFLDVMKKTAAYSMNVRTVMPSSTAPCHFSLFTSTPPSRHGVTGIRFMFPANPDDYVPTIFDMCDGGFRKSAMFYSWEYLRDLSNPECIHYALFMSVKKNVDPDKRLSDGAIEYINAEKPDFVFLYLGENDNVGHKYGWMSDEQIATMSNAWDCIEKVCTSIPEEYAVIVTSDHGGHGLGHGTDAPEDMTIPLFIRADQLEAGRVLENVSILDIAPTIADIISLEKAEEWEGKSLI